MALEQAVRTIAALVFQRSHGAAIADPVASGDGDGGPKAESLFRFGPPLLLFAGMSLVGGGLWITQASGTVKFAVDVTGVTLEVNKRDVEQRDIVSELAGMKYEDKEALHVRELRSTGKGPWAFPKRVVAARTRADLRSYEVAVCRDSDLLGERLLLATTSEVADGHTAVDVSAAVRLLGCSSADSGDEVILVGPDVAKELTGSDAGGEIDLTVTVLPNDQTRTL